MSTYENTNNQLLVSTLPTEVETLFYYNQAVMNKISKMSVSQKYACWDTINICIIWVSLNSNDG